uniref:DUF2428 domain-containing protein n=1 Tax=Trichuris muris TaxID=70415 RepID=A0A5S6R3T7_TRIMR
MSSIGCTCTGSGENSVCRHLTEFDEGPLRRRAAQALWMAYFKGNDVSWLGHVTEKSAHLIDKLIHPSMCENVQSDIWNLSELEGYVVAGYVSTAPAEKLNCARNVNFLQSLYIGLCDRALRILPSGNLGPLVAIECCLLRALKKKPEALDSFRQFVCGESASEKLLHIVRCCWNSEFAGVADLSIRIFELWLETNVLVNEVGASALRLKLLRHYLDDYPWFYRGRYRAIASLMNRCTTSEIVEVHELLYECWKASMNCAQIAPLASKLWRIALTRCDDRLELWLPMMGRLLLGQGQICALIGRHWLPMVNDVGHDSFQGLIGEFRLRLTSLKRQLVPHVETALLSNLLDIGGADQDVQSSLDRTYKAASVVLKQFFNSGQWRGAHVKANWNLLDEVGRCAEDCARVGYFEVLCRHSPKNVMSSDWHRDRVHQFLFKNLTVTSQSFRLSVTSSYRHYLMKMERIGSLDSAWLRRFMDTILSQLFPGANLQRYLSSLNLLLVALDSCSRFKALWLERFAEQSMWTMQAISILMRCFLHSCTDIRDLAVRIATNHCSQAFAVDAGAVQFCMQIAFDLIDRPTLGECDVGASLLLCLSSSADRYREEKMDAENDAEADVKRCILFNLVFPLLDTLCSGDRDGSIPPVFGRLRACSLLWPNVRDALPTDFVLQLVNAIVGLALKVLHRLGSHDTSACPSLPEMHSAVGVELGQNEALLPLALKAVLWNVTEGCGLIVQCAGTLIELKCVAGLHSIRDLFFEVMIRNRSVIIHDECENHLISFCTICLQAPWSIANSVVMELTERTLSHIEHASPVSALRRAGGYPYLLSCLVRTASTFKEGQVLSHALERLVKMGFEAVEDLDGSTGDSALLRALHCLRIIVLSSECHEGCRPYLANVFRLAVFHLNSPSWSIRNAVSMLLAAVVRALFVRSIIQKDTIGDPWAQDILQFWSCHRDIWEQCVRAIVDVADSMKSRPLDPRLHPLLIVFQNVVVDDARIVCKCLEMDLQQCRLALTKILVRSPEWSIRRLAAKALSNMTPPRKRPLVVERIQGLSRHLKGSPNLLDAVAKLVKALEHPSKWLNGEHLSISVGSSGDISQLCKLFARGVDLDNDAAQLRERLIESCAGAYGCSLQTLALPVLTKLMVFSHGDLFAEWSRFVIRFAAEANDERLRYAAAISLALAGKVVLNFLHDSERHAELLMAICSLLQDDCDHIRKAVSQISVCCGGDSQVPLAYSECMEAVLDYAVGQEAAYALVDRLLDELLPDVNCTFPNEPQKVNPTDCIHYSERYTVLSAYYNCLSKFAARHPASFGRLCESKLTEGQLHKTLDRVYKSVANFFEDDFRQSALRLTSERFELVVRLCLTDRLLKSSRSNSYLDLILPASGGLEWLTSAEKGPDFHTFGCHISSTGGIV